jgi:hypothetical protein
LAASWLCWSIYDAWRFTFRSRDLKLIVLYQDGSVIVVYRSGLVLSAALSPGTVVTSHFAWLRLKLRNGTTSAEFLRRKTVKAVDWHRLQLIWAQGRPFIGSDNGS